jgi:hypothetical protein
MQQQHQRCAVRPLDTGIEHKVADGNPVQRHG